MRSAGRGFGYVAAIQLGENESRAANRTMLPRRVTDGPPVNPTFPGSDRDGALIVLPQDGTVRRLERKGRIQGFLIPAFFFPIPSRESRLR